MHVSREQVKQYYRMIMKRWISAAIGLAVALIAQVMFLSGDIHISVAFTLGAATVVVIMIAAHSISYLVANVIDNENEIDQRNGRP